MLCLKIGCPVSPAMLQTLSRSRNTELKYRFENIVQLCVDIDNQKLSRYELGEFDVKTNPEIGTDLAKDRNNRLGYKSCICEKGTNR